jgi:glycosyltransferase involved in cell wall biosynthesis
MNGGIGNPVSMRADMKVSVVIPAFNAELTVHRALQSVLSQSAPIYEIIVVDDGSADRTISVAESFGDRVTIVAQENAGPSAARNLGANKATGGLLAFLDADDVWHPEKIKAQLSVFSAVPDLALCSTGFVRFGTREAVPFGGDWDGAWQVASDFLVTLRNPYLGTPTVLMRADVFRTCNGFDHSLRFGEDVDLWLRASFNRVTARIPFAFTGVAMSETSLTWRGGESADMGNLAVLDKFVREHADYALLHRSDILRAQAEVQTRIGSSRLARGDRKGARSALREAWRNDRGNIRALYLWGRSFTPLRKNR